MNPDRGPACEPLSIADRLTGRSGHRQSAIGDPGIARFMCDRRIDRDGSAGWDAYAPFYDWENARTMGRRDVAFWQRLARARGGPILELGCGTGRVLAPVARRVAGTPDAGGLPIVGVDRSAPMLERARRRLGRAGALRAALVRADIRQLPFVSRFALVMAPYGILQSLTRERDLARTLEAVARATRPGGQLGVDLVPDLSRWKEYRRRVTLRGRTRGARVALVESVRQDRRRGLTIFDEEYVERRGATRRVHRFSLAFRTLSVKQMAYRIERAGFRVDALLGDYDGRPWGPRADVWLILATRL